MFICSGCCLVFKLGELSRHRAVLWLHPIFCWAGYFVSLLYEIINTKNYTSFFFSFLNLFSRSGNDWGCSDGLCCVGCGDRQEEFYACADIRISPRGTRYPTTWPTVTRSTTRPPTTWRYPATTWRYTYPTTRAPPVTYQPSIATTRKTTPKPTSSYFYYPIYEYFKRYPYNYTPGGTSIKFPGSGNNNNNNNTPRNSIIAFQDLIIGRNAEIVTRDGLSVPIPMSYNNTSPADADIIKDYLTRDRYCAACDNGCPFDRCSTFCPHICSISYLGSNQS